MSMIVPLCKLHAILVKSEMSSFVDYYELLQKDVYQVWFEDASTRLLYCDNVCFWFQCKHRECVPFSDMHPHSYCTVTNHNRCAEPMREHGLGEEWNIVANYPVPKMRAICE